MVLHGSGSLVYGIEPGDALFEASGWHDLADRKSILRPHFETTKRMLGVIVNPRMSLVDIVM